MYSYEVLEQAIMDFYKRYPKAEFIPTEAELIAEELLEKVLE